MIIKNGSEMMILLHGNQLTKSYATDPIFKDISIEIQHNDRIALIGKNGAGKSTLMKILAQIESYDSGDLSIKKQCKIGYLSQTFDYTENETVRQSMKSVFKDTLEIKDQLDELTYTISINPTEENLKQFESVQSKFEALDGYSIDHKIESIITGLGFNKSDLDQKIASFSGGQKTRLSLAKLLLTSPDILMLDEPTNHLDMDTVDWLEQYLIRYEGALLIISHDRYFLDKIVNKTYHMTFNRLDKYHGNYSTYLKEKQLRLEDAKEAYITQQKEIKKLETFVQKNIARASTSNMAKSRRKQLEKMDRLDNPMIEATEMNLSFDIHKQSGKDVFTLKGLTVGYDKPLKENINLSIYKDDRIGIIGPNGVGKSTLIKTIAKEIPPIDGEVIYGSNVKVGYYDQAQAEIFTNNTILEELWSTYPDYNESYIRTVLGRFLFTQDDVLKIVKDLSGGEKARLQLAKLMLQDHNVLIFDEPTNHLDMDSKEVLESALSNYPGTIIFVSHDRYFIDAIANKILSLYDNQYEWYLGNYSYYLEKKAEQSAIDSVQVDSSTDETTSPSNSSYQQEKELKNKRRKLEKERDKLLLEIEQYEAEIDTINHQMTDDHNVANIERLTELQYDKEKIQSIIQDKLDQWESIEIELEEMIDK